jgi:trans-aconitate methyltransferase
LWDNFDLEDFMENKIAEFDSISTDYNAVIVKCMGKFGKYRDTAFVYKAQYLKHLLRNEPRSILDFGCGVGSFIPYLRENFKNTKLYGCDVSSESIKIAKANHSYCDFKVIQNIPDLQAYEKIDCIIINTVLHHIPQNEHAYWINGLYEILNNNNGGGGGNYYI